MIIWEFDLRECSHFPQTLRVNSERGKASLVDCCLALLVYGKKMINQQQQKIHNLASAAPSIMHTFRSAEIQHIYTDHQSVADWLVVGTWMVCGGSFCCFFYEEMHFVACCGKQRGMGRA